MAATALDQGQRENPVHCRVCFVKGGAMVAATWQRDGYNFCDAHKDAKV